ncbi:MAG: hypothetical protein KC713_10015 [Candidatus Omnitrophica bacterium]|nr:hypothetical protein [Candidatus Omnitrophota bacterium]
MAENLRTKKVVSQPKARRKVKLDVSKEQKNYEKHPEREDDQLTEAEEQNVLEENDYAGVRPIDDKHNVTEKGKSRKDKNKD